MEAVSRKRDRLFLLFSAMFIALLLTGCPKKVSPLAKTPKSPAIINDRSLEGGEGRFDAPPDGGGTATVDEEEIPSTTVDASAGNPEEPVMSPKLHGQGGKTANLTDIFFDYGQSSVRSTDIPLLEKNVKWLLANPHGKIEVEGHADKRGTNEYNLVLAEKRARAVHEYFVQLGIDSSKILVVSFGEERPFCTVEDEACFQENRRAHFNVE